MAKDTYEVRGIKYVTSAGQLAMSHMCTFSISLRLPTRKYWVAYFKWQSGSSRAQHKHVSQSGKPTAIATGANVSPSHLMVEAGMFPKDVLDYDSSGTLHYTRYKGSKVVPITIDVMGSSKRVTLRFNMAESAPASLDEELVMQGKVGLWLQKNDEWQTLQSSPNAAPPHPVFNAYAP